MFGSVSKKEKRMKSLLRNWLAAWVADSMDIWKFKRLVWCEESMLFLTQLISTYHQQTSQSSPINYIYLL